MITKEELGSDRHWIMFSKELYVEWDKDKLIPLLRTMQSWYTGVSYEDTSLDDIYHIILSIHEKIGTDLYKYLKERNRDLFFNRKYKKDFRLTVDWEIYKLIQEFKLLKVREGEECLIDLDIKDKDMELFDRLENRWIIEESSDVEDIEILD